MKSGRVRPSFALLEVAPSGPYDREGRAVAPKGGEIGEMAHRGAPVKEIVEDYPSIDEQDVEFAKQFVTAYPRALPRRFDARHHTALD